MKRMLLRAILIAASLNGSSDIRAENRRHNGEVEPPFERLPLHEQKAVGDVLRSWEQQSKSIERYRCQFQRWEYDPIFGPAQTFKTWSKGLITYSVPEGSVFRVEETRQYTSASESDDKPKYVKREDESTEHWVCGRACIWEFDHKSKTLIGRKLPPYLQGRMIVGPLTFRFFCPPILLRNPPKRHEGIEGQLQLLSEVDAERLKQRYWIRPHAADGSAKAHRLELYPKSSRDAEICQKMDVVIAQEDSLPKGLVIYDRNFNPRSNPARTVFLFENRQTNWELPPNEPNAFKRQFSEPQVPHGWIKVVEGL